MSAASLERALRALGVHCTVEAHDRLALIVPEGPVRLEQPDARQAALRLLPDHGFTHLALELVDEEGAPLPRD